MAQKPKRGTGMPLPPAPPEGGPDDQDYVYMSPSEQQAVQPYYGLPLMTPEMRRYRVGGRQMMDPRNFEYIKRKREEARTQGTRLKKGGPVKKKYAAGGEVGEADRPEERGPVGLHYNRYLERMRKAKEDELRNQPSSAAFERALLNAKKATRGPDAGGSERLAREAAEAETARKSRVAEAQRGQRFWERALEDEGKRINQRRDPTRVEDNGYKKGGKVGKYADGGMVEIEIKVGGGGKHKMPDGSMMYDDEMEDAEEYKKGGRVKKMAAGGTTGGSPIVPAGVDITAGGNRPVGGGRTMPGNFRNSPNMQPRPRPVVAPSRPGMPIGAPVGTGGPRGLMPRPGMPGSATGPTPNIGGVPGAIMKKGGKVMAKAPVKKAAGGKVAAKPVAKKAGGRVAAKPMTKGRKK